MKDILARQSARTGRRVRPSRLLGVLGVTTALALAATAQGADHGLIGDQLLLKDGNSRKLTVKSKDGANILAPTGDPTVSGATLMVTLVNTGGTQTETFTLDAANWKASGNPVKQYKYKGPKGTAIKSITLGFLKQVKISGAPLTLSLAGAPAISAKVVLSIDASDSYCIDFTTPANPNTVAMAKWGRQTVAGTCAVVPPSTTTSTTAETPTTTTSTTTTLPESTVSTCGTATGQRLVVVTLNTPEPLAGVQVVLKYPQFETSIPGSGNTDTVGSRVFLFPSEGVSIFNDTDSDINTVFANTTNFLTSGPVFAANFDECVPIDQNICNRAPTITGCCNNPADPTQFGNFCARYNPPLSCSATAHDTDCPGPDNSLCTASGMPYPCCTGAGTGTCTPSDFCLGNGNPVGCCTGVGTGTCTGPNGSCVVKCPTNPPVCAPGSFPTGIPAGPCTAPAGGCPGDNECITQTSATLCTVSAPVKFVSGQSLPVDGVTCTVTIL